MIRHSQSAIERNAEIVHGRRQRHRPSAQLQLSNVNFRQLLPGADPDDLRLLGVQFQSTACRPSTDAVNTIGESLDGGSSVVRRRTEIYLGVVGVRMRRETAL